MKNLADQNTREIILQNALALFAYQGYDGVSIKEICDTSKITKPTLYYYFGSKEGIYKTILIENYKDLDVFLRKCCIYHPKPDDYYKDIHPVLLGVIMGYFDFAKGHKDFYYLVLRGAFSYHEESPAKFVSVMEQSQHEKLLQLFQDFSSVHTHMKGKEHIFAETLLGMINTYILLWYKNKQGLDEKLAQLLLHQYMHGIHA